MEGRLDPLVEGEALDALRLGQEELSALLEEVECPRELGLANIECLRRLLASRVTPAGPLEVQRDRGERRGEIVKEGA